MSSQPKFVPSAIGISSLNASAKPFVPIADFEMVCTPIVDPDKSALTYPFSFIAHSNEEDWNRCYKVDNWSEGLLAEEKCDAGNFPNNITEFYWLHEGHNDDDAWELLCRLDNGNFAFYSAWCDYTGFDCQGGMKLIVSKDLKRLFYEGLTERQRELCFKEKKITPKPNTHTYCRDLASAGEDWSYPVPVVPTPKPAAEASYAFIRIWHNDKELILNLDNVNGLEMEELEFAICGLTAQFLTPKPGTKGPTPKKVFYTVNICAGTRVFGIDNYFKKRFGNPEKKWLLRMRHGCGHNGFIRKWGKVEVSFILY
jgi:hypothetical protein